MRHFALSLPPAACPLSVGVTAASAALVALPGRAQRGAARRARTLRRAVALSAVTGAADQHLGTAARAQKQTRRGIHRRLPGQAEEIWTATRSSRNTVRSLSCARTGVGHGTDLDRQVQGSVPCRLSPRRSVFTCDWPPCHLPAIVLPRTNLPPGHCTPSTLTHLDSASAQYLLGAPLVTQPRQLDSAMFTRFLAAVHTGYLKAARSSRLDV
jgi:hypothetical protein